MHTKTTRRSCLRPEKEDTEEQQQQLWLREGGPRLLRHCWGFVVLTVCHLLTVLRSREGGGQEDRDEPDNTQRGWSEPFRSLTQLVRLPNPTLKPHKAFMELTQEKKTNIKNNMSALAASRDTLPQKSDAVEPLEVSHTRQKRCYRHRSHNHNLLTDILNQKTDTE